MVPYFVFFKEKLKQALRISTMPKAKTYFKYELYAFKLTTIIMDYTMQCTQSYLKVYCGDFYLNTPYKYCSGKCS